MSCVFSLHTCAHKSHWYTFRLSTATAINCQLLYLVFWSTPCFEADAKPWPATWSPEVRRRSCSFAQWSWSMAVWPCWQCWAGFTWPQGITSWGITRWESTWTTIPWWIWLKCLWVVFGRWFSPSCAWSGSPHMFLAPHIWRRASFKFGLSCVAYFF